MIKNITNEEEGLVELLPITKHKFEDGDEILLTQVVGMDRINQTVGETASINETIHKVKVLTPYTFRIGNTLGFDKYQRNGIAKQLKTKKLMTFKSFKQVMLEGADLPLDGNLAVADFEKIQNNILSHIAFNALDSFRSTNSRLPGKLTINMY